MKTENFRKLITLLGFFLGFYIIAVILQPILFANRFGAFTKISGVDVSFQTSAAAETHLAQAYSEYSKEKISVGGESVVAGDYITEADAKETVKQALLAEQSEYFGFSKYTGKNHQAALVYNDTAIKKLLLTAYNKVATVPVDASLKTGAKTMVIPERMGKRLLLVESRERLQSGLADMSSSIDLETVSQVPELTAKEAEGVISEAEASMTEPITIYGENATYTILPSDLHSWLKISSSKPKSLLAKETYLPQVRDYYFLDQNKVFLYVDSLAKGIDKPAINARLVVTDGKVVVGANEQIGQTVDRKDAISQIQQAVMGDRTATLKIVSVTPEIRADNLTGMGLTELVSTGWSDFSGSPVNRTVNVKVGASKFNGVLIKPGEKFSFNKALGPVDASTGYLPELVILADKTVPEFGGGLCQVSSTAFRAALNGGLPILERHAHAYPIGYYLPYGVDATIYLPSPDLRFENDTSKYILIQTRIEGKKLYFDFYGTKKPGKVTFSGNDKATGAVEAVEKVKSTLTDLGIRGKNSFTAVFYRHIYDANGKLTDNDKFTSKYESPDKYPH